MEWMEMEWNGMDGMDRRKMDKMDMEWIKEQNGMGILPKAISTLPSK